MQSAVWPPGGRHGILKCSIVTHYRCLLKANKNSCVNSTTNPFSTQTGGNWDIFWYFHADFIFVFFKEKLFCVMLMLSYITLSSGTIKHVMSRATLIKL